MSSYPKQNPRGASLFAPYQPKTTGEKRVIQILLIASLLVIIAVLAFYFLNPSPTHIIGYQLVNNANGQAEEIPSGSFFPFYAKPVTYLFAAGIVAGYCSFSLSQEFINRKLPRWLRTFLLIFSVLLLAVALYEVLFSFTYWGAALVTHADPDTVVDNWPISSIKINETFATKMMLLWAVLSFLSVMAFKKSLDSD